MLRSERRKALFILNDHVVVEEIFPMPPILLPTGSLSRVYRVSDTAIGRVTRPHPPIRCGMHQEVMSLAVGAH